jgi:signal transduction histidine kinase
MWLSLRYRLLLPLALLLAADMAVTAWAAVSAARGADRALAARLRRVAHLPAEPPTFPLSEPVLVLMKRLSGAELMRVRPDRGWISTFPDPSTPPPADVRVATSGERDDVHLGPPVAVADIEYRCLCVQLKAPHPNAGDDLYIFYPESERRKAVWDAARPPLLLGGLGGLLAVGLAVAIGSGLVRRIRDLQQRTRLIAAGDFRPVPLPRPDDELKDLYRSVNDMACRLADYQEALRRTERLRILGQFSGGLAHQLRNAAAGARLAVELFLAENPAADPEPLQVALRQLARIEANLRQFLDLGKPPDVEKQQCDLVMQIGHAVSLLTPQCQHAGIALKWQPPATPVVLSGDATQLSHLFGNVIGNAVEAAGPGGVVEVTLASTRRGAIVQITDTGPGPPSDIAIKLFEPFVTGKTEGVGLGLAVARQAVEAHGGSITWDRRDARTVFVIELPMG